MEVGDQVTDQDWLERCATAAVDLNPGEPLSFEAINQFLGGVWKSYTPETGREPPEGLFFALVSAVTDRLRSAGREYRASRPAPEPVHDGYLQLLAEARQRVKHSPAVDIAAWRERFTGAPEQPGLVVVTGGETEREPYAIYAPPPPEPGEDIAAYLAKHADAYSAMDDLGHTLPYDPRPPEQRPTKAAPESTDADWLARYTLYVDPPTTAAERVRLAGAAPAQYRRDTGREPPHDLIARVFAALG